MDTIANVFGAYTDAARDSMDAEEACEARRRIMQDVPHSVARREALSHSEVVRVEELWKQAKDELHAKNREIASLKAQFLRQDAADKDADVNSLRGAVAAQINGLKDRARFFELQATDAKAACDRMRNKLNDVLARLSESLKVLEEKAAVQQAMTGLISEMEARVAALQIEREKLIAEKAEVVAKSMEMVALHDQAMTARAEEIANVHGQLTARQTSLLTTQEERDAAERRAAQLETTVAQLQRRDTGFQAETAQLCEQLAALQDEKTDYLMQRTLVAHLRHDNARLVRLLLSTAEYRLFISKTFPLKARGFVEDEGHEGSRSRAAQPGNATADRRRVRSMYLGALPRTGTGGASRFSRNRRTEADVNMYLGGSPELFPVQHQPVRGTAGHTTGINEAEAESLAAWTIAEDWDALTQLEEEYGVESSEHSTSRDHTSSFAASGGQASMEAKEQDDWVPAEVVATTARFRLQHLQHVPLELLREFLVTINKQWNRRYELLSGRVQQKYASEITELKRQLNQRDPYREVLQASTIARLHTELQSLRDMLGRGIQNAGPLTTNVGRPLSPARRRLDGVAGGALSPSGGRRLPRAASAGRLMGKRLSGAAAASAPALAVNLLSVPGSGGQRLDADDTGRLFEHALAAVDTLSRQVKEVAADNERLKAALTSSRQEIAAARDAAARTGTIVSAGRRKQVQRPQVVKSKQASNRDRAQPPSAEDDDSSGRSTFDMPYTRAPSAPVAQQSDSGSRLRSFQRSIQEPVPHVSAAAASLQNHKRVVAWLRSRVMGSVSAMTRTITATCTALLESAGQLQQDVGSNRAVVLTELKRHAQAAAQIRYSVEGCQQQVHAVLAEAEEATASDNALSQWSAKVGGLLGRSSQEPPRWAPTGISRPGTKHPGTESVPIAADNAGTSAAGVSSVGSATRPEIAAEGSLSDEAAIGILNT